MSNRSPEQYFREQDFSADAVNGQGFTEAEQAFMDKYLGVQAGQVLQSLGIPAPDSFTAGSGQVRGQDCPASAAPSGGAASGASSPASGQGMAESRSASSPSPAASAGPPETAEVKPAEIVSAATVARPPATSDQAAANAAPEPVQERLSEILRRESELLLVGFFLGEQEFVVPTQAVQEVIRYMPPTKLPAAPPCIAGVINLRGKVTPLIRLRELLSVKPAEVNKDVFTIVCRRSGLQFGLMIERVHTMYRVRQEDIDWGVEAHFGSNVDFVSGLLKLGENLVGIVSVDRILETIIRS